MPLAVTSATVPSVSRGIPVAFWGTPYDQLTKKKTWAWFTDDSAQSIGKTQKP